MKQRPAKLAVALTLLCAGAIASPASANDKVSQFKLKNGMEIVVIEDHRAPVVEQMIWYRAGSADEKPGVSGVAHFLEHLMFKATDNMASGELSKVVARNGGSDNAFTTFDYTAYYQRVAVDRLPLMMKMEADRMMNLKLTEADIASERNVIIEERNMRIENNPTALFREQKSAAQYLNSHYGIPVIGWKREMSKLSRADALAFYKRFYAPNNAVLVVAGDVEPDAVRALAEKYYGPLKPNPDLKPRNRPQEPRQMGERRIMFHDARVAQPYVSRSYLAPERNHDAQEKAAALVLLAELLGGGQTSWLNEKLQFEKHLVVHTGAYYSGTSLDATTFHLVAVPADGVSLQEVEDAMDAALKDFFAKGIDSAQLKRIKFQLRASQIYASDDVDRLANRYGSALTQGLTVEDVQAWPDILQNVTEEQILAAGHEVLKRNNSVTGWLMGKADKAVTQ
ncbi:pitrilysin family protein [Aquicoccus sp. G2-2]|uniref:M16 family metallopeptidase n=1 Tax=Aquicoccus sp. G2-2 TaxID=3092120 RepID=UPI002AE0A99E|nr:pitrilysin family protein [Aquicoccus sp. G2-2]MEA1114844.1 pitrilysin family protein [Aquicoccus sp. G2-2]